MDKQSLKIIWQKLLTEKRELEREIQRFEFAREESLQASTKELSLYDNHPADIASETLEREKDLALKNNRSELLAKVNNALEAIKLGNYGKCTGCEAEIPGERLQVLPYTKLCIECQRKAETSNQQQRPALDQENWPDFSGEYLSEEETPGINGKDIWKELNDYGTSSS